ncbi:MAG: hypothetical protein WC000_13815 [Dokdonella sp.]
MTPIPIIAAIPQTLAVDPGRMRNKPNKALASTANASSTTKAPKTPPSSHHCAYSLCALLT